MKGIYQKKCANMFVVKGTLVLFAIFDIVVGLLACTLSYISVPIGVLMISVGISALYSLRAPNAYTFIFTLVTTVGFCVILKILSATQALILIVLLVSMHNVFLMSVDPTSMGNKTFKAHDVLRMHILNCYSSAQDFSQRHECRAHFRRGDNLISPLVVLFVAALGDRRVLELRKKQ
uniref:Inner membrane protein n=1 Tax=Steinernema glaseri TaxID=37863 RepID=A0A1I7YTK1_9BILA